MIESAKNFWILSTKRKDRLEYSLYAGPHFITKGTKEEIDGLLTRIKEFVKSEERHIEL